MRSALRAMPVRSEERRVGEEGRYWRDWSSDVCSSDLLARSRLSDVKYDCLGCEVCWPALAINALGVEGDACPGEAAEAREGWPQLPGAYTVLRYHAPVAVCTLTDESLSKTVVPVAGAKIALVGTMQT